MGAGKPVQMMGGLATPHIKINLPLQGRRQSPVLYLVLAAPGYSLDTFESKVNRMSKEPGVVGCGIRKTEWTPECSGEKVTP